MGSGGYRSYGGGLVVNGALTVRNSTVAFNTAGRGGGGIFGLGYPIELDSTIVANNTAAYTGYFGADIGGYGTLSGADDLIIASDLGVPDGTLAVDPLLLPLANNGGPTATHPGAPTLGWDGFATLREGVSLPLYALGGMKPADIDTARRHGAQGIAAIRGLWPGQP